MLKKHMFPLRKGGVLQAHRGKGSQQAPMPSRQQINSLTQPGADMNDYAKATPLAQPAPTDVPTEGGF